MKMTKPLLHGQRSCLLHYRVVAPGIYTANGKGAGVAAAVVQRSSTPNASSLTFSCQTGVALSCLSVPISAGTAADTVYVTLYGTGIRGAKAVKVFVAGQTVPVLYSGAQGQYQGLDQVNIGIPPALAAAG